MNQNMFFFCFFTIVVLTMVCGTPFSHSRNGGRQTNLDMVVFNKDQ